MLCYGDVNLDYKVNSADARLLLRFCARLCTLKRKQCVIGDIDRSGRVNSSDARKALRLASRLEKTVEFKETVKNPDEVLKSYGKSEKYQPYLYGFSTNIDDPDLFPQIRKLEDYCDYLGRTATLYYTDVNRQYYISYNSDRVYRTHCTIKAPYIKSLLEYLEKNKIPLSTELTLNSSVRKWPGHTLSYYPDGTRFSLSTLMSYALRESDNTAYQMLFNTYGSGIFNANAAKVGADLRLGSYLFGETSARDMTKLYLDVYNYKGAYRDFLFWEMNRVNGGYGARKISAGIPEGVTVLRKDGSGGDDVAGYHDCVIVFDNTPFVLIVYSSFNLDWGYSISHFQKIGSFVYNINHALH